MDQIVQEHAFNLRWRAVIVLAAIYLGFAVFIAYSAVNYMGIVFALLMVLSGLFVALAFVLVFRRLIFPRVLLLTDREILIPYGFLRTRVRHVKYNEIVHITEYYHGLYIYPGFIRFEGTYLPDIESYREVRTNIYTRAFGYAPPEDKSWGPADRKWMEFPDPVCRWKEPENWPQFRAYPFTSKPLFSRLAKVLWFSVRCYGVLLLPWFALRYFGLQMDISYFVLALAVTALFTMIYAVSQTCFGVMNITVRERGLSVTNGKQVWDYSFNRLSGWSVIEKQFHEHTLLILLLKLPSSVFPIALPDVNIRDQIVQLLQKKEVPQVSGLKLPWEKEY